MTQRILIAGGPKVGKTTFASRFTNVRRTDDLIGELGWSEASEEVARWIDEPGPWCIEGVAVVRAVRKWLASHPSGSPADIFYWGTTAKVHLIPGQLSLMKGCVTVWNEVLPALRARGLLPIYF